MTPSDGDTSHTRLAERAGVDTAHRRERGDTVVAEVGGRGLHSIRLAFVDPHGVLRGKTLRADLLADVLDNGAGITSALLMKDTGQNNIYPVWAPGAGLGKPWLTGAGDMMMLPDPFTFRTLPWADGVGWLLCDLFSPDGEPVALSTRRACARAEQALAERGYHLRAGLEIEFHLYKLDDQHLEVSGTAASADRLELNHSHLGRMYLGEQRFDQIEPLLEPLRRDLAALGLAPRSIEIELGPSQVELTFSPTAGLEAADQAVLLRSAVKQISYRHGLHATFMGRPNIANSFSSGWHLHQSLVDAETGDNVFVPSVGDHLISTLGSHFVSGLLAHAAESCLLTTPTVTGYKRYRPESLAPDRVAWGREHRGAMLRIIGGIGDPSTRVENRIGDSAANPYLYLASQMVSGLAGLDAGEMPPPSTDSPYDKAAGPLLPRNLGEAIDAFEPSDLYRTALGDELVDYLVTLKRAEWNRFMSTVTDWEQRVYFELF